MPFSFRKSFKVGKFGRVTLSKSGVSGSVGTKHARLTKGPKGTRVSAGASGVRYQKQVGSAPKKRKRFLGIF